MILYLQSIPCLISWKGILRRGKVLELHNCTLPSFYVMFIQSSNMFDAPHRTKQTLCNIKKNKLSPRSRITSYLAQLYE